MVVGETSGSVTEPGPFYLGRPFLFTIHDVEYGTPLFLGRVDARARECASLRHGSLRIRRSTRST